MKTEFQVRMISGRFSALVATYDDQPEAILVCEGETLDSGVSHCVRKVCTETVYRTYRTPEPHVEEAAIVGALFFERLCE